MIKNFRELLSNVQQKPIEEQKQIIENTIVNWIGNNEQTDDISVIGIRF
jgi:serine phosphatase RsbU (regulator of sigma subunit)